MATYQCDLIDRFLAGDAQKTGKYGFSQLEEEQLLPEGNVLPFNYLLTLQQPQEYWVHCFIDDAQFQRLWNNFWCYLPKILSLNGFLGTDFSLYRDYDDDLLIRNCRRNRDIAFAIQKAGGRVIPTAGFADERSWEWCFDGLPQNSTVAVTTNGVLSDPEAMRLFIGGIDAMVSIIHPFAIVVCGKYPSWLNDKYPSIKIVHIPSYSQIWRARRCG